VGRRGKEEVLTSTPSSEMEKRSSMKRKWFKPLTAFQILKGKEKGGGRQIKKKGEREGKRTRGFRAHYLAGKNKLKTPPGNVRKNRKKSSQKRLGGLDQT